MMRIGLIGCGHIAHKHLETIAQIQDLELVAVSDIYDEKMQSIKSIYNDLCKTAQSIRLYKNYRDLLLDKAIDIVIVSVFSGLHAEMSKQAILQNKHVIIEKPFALSLREANEIVQ